MNGRELQQIPAGEKVKTEQWYAAKYNEDGLYYRCKILHIGVGRQKPSVLVGCKQNNNIVYYNSTIN